MKEVGCQNGNITVVMVVGNSLAQLFPHALNACLLFVRYKITTIIDYAWQYPWLIIMQLCTEVGDTDDK